MKEVLFGTFSQKLGKTPFTGPALFNLVTRGDKNFLIADSCVHYVEITVVCANQFWSIVSEATNNSRLVIGWIVS